MRTTVSKEYNIFSGKLLLVIEYNYTNLFFNSLDVLVLDDLEVGYEDEDSLIFYPAKLTLTLKDYEAGLYNTLKESSNLSVLSNRSTLTDVKLYHNNILIFRGYINAESLNYDKVAQTTKFQSVDYSVFLKDLAVDSIDTYSNLPYTICQIFNKCYPEFQEQPDIGYPIAWSPGDYGLYWRHDWVWEGRYEGTYQYSDWSSIVQATELAFNWDSCGLFGEQRHASTFGDLLKLLSNQFGLIIGASSYGCLHAVKRFGINYIDREILSSEVEEFTKNIFLEKKIGVRIVNEWNGLRNYDAGQIDLINNGTEFKYKNFVINFKTYVPMYIDGGNMGTAVFLHRSGIIYPVWAVKDPNIQQWTVNQTLAEWIYNSRKNYKDKYEFDLFGINFHISSLYKFYTCLGGENNLYRDYIKFRPINIKKSYVENKTKLIGVEL